MDEIVLLGMNHKTAPVELRECLAFSAEETCAALERLKTSAVISEVMVISTCNRVEILMAADNRDSAVEAAKLYLAESKKMTVADFESALYIHSDDAAVRHIFRVAASLDSMVVGEPQILGQIKNAYRSATSKKTSGVLLNRLMHRTFSVAKRVRTETGIGDNAVSISYAAIELGKKIFGTLEGKKALLVGAGEMAELAVEHLIRNKSGDIIVANRTFDRGILLAKRFNGSAIRFEEIVDFLQLVDIVISSTGSSEYVIQQADVKKVLRGRKNRPLFFIDIAVPRDIDPAINQLANTYVYDIDDLAGIIEENIEDRNREAIKGERIVDEAVIRFRQWVEGLEVVPTIVDLRKKLHTIAETEIKKTLQNLKHLSDTDRQALIRMTDAIINKIMHDPTQRLKSNEGHGSKSKYLDIIRKLFNLDA